jgi:hypothetical protein
MFQIAPPDPEMGSNMARRTGRQFDLDQMKPLNKMLRGWILLR